MSLANAFTPAGPTVLVGTTTVQTSPDATQRGYRVRNLSASVQYFTHGMNNSITSLGAPSAGSPSNNTIGMLGSSVETFYGLGAFMIAGTSTGFEVTPGDGI